MPGKNEAEDSDGEGGEGGEDGQGGALPGGEGVGKRKGRGVPRPPGYLSLLGTSPVEAFNRMVNELTSGISHIGWEKAELKLNYLVYKTNLKRLRRMWPDEWKRRGWEPDWAMLLEGGFLGNLPPTDELFGAHYFNAQQAREAANPGCIKAEYNTAMERWRQHRRDTPGELQEPWVACDACTKWRLLPANKKNLLWECAGEQGKRFTCSMIPGGDCDAMEETGDDQVASAPSSRIVTTSHPSSVPVNPKPQIELKTRP